MEFERASTLPQDDAKMQNCCNAWSERGGVRLGGIMLSVRMVE